MRLGRAPEEILLGDVVRRTEGPLELVECFDPETSECRIESSCLLSGVLHDALRAFLGVLDRYTLADLVSRRRAPLRRLLEVH